MFKFLNDTYQVVISYSKLFDATGITCSPTKYHRLCLIYSIKKRCNSIAQFEKKMFTICREDLSRIRTVIKNLNVEDKRMH